MHAKEVRRYEKDIPSFTTDGEAENLVYTADLNQYDLKGTFVRFELRPKDKTVSLRLPESLLAAERARAERDGVPYQRFIRLAVERALDSN